MTNLRNLRTRHFDRLLEIARRSGVQVHFIPAQPFGDLGWKGLYVTTPTMGAGIALRDDLEPDERDWFLAHELGHHFSSLNLQLFSPFCAHMIDAGTQQRWSELRTLHPDEVRANNWALRALISRQDWDSAERMAPCDLPKIVKSLGLPVVAGVAWGRRSRTSIIHTDDVRVRFDAAEWAKLHRPINGDGGHQSFFRRILRQPKGREAILDFGDFTLARERVLQVGGGWRERYRTLLDGVEASINASGGVTALFHCAFAETED
jgi:hypothetical protein